MLCTSCKGDGETSGELPCPACLGTGLFKTDEEILQHHIKETKHFIEISEEEIKRLKYKLSGLKKSLRIIEEGKTCEATDHCVMHKNEKYKLSNDKQGHWRVYLGDKLLGIRKSYAEGMKLIRSF